MDCRAQILNYFSNNMMKLPRLLLGSTALCLALNANAADPLETGFFNPPDSAKPQTWWHWIRSRRVKFY